MLNRYTYPRQTGHGDYEHTLLGPSDTPDPRKRDYTLMERNEGASCLSTGFCLGKVPRKFKDGVRKTEQGVIHFQVASTL